MHLTKMEIQEFGLFQSTSFESMEPGLTVVFGRNETGKTTLMHFLRGMFYGFSSQERSKYLTNRLPGNSDRPGGGTIQMAGGGDNVHELTRTATCDADGVWRDQVVLKGDGAPVADPAANTEPAPQVTSPSEEVQIQEAGDSAADTAAAAMDAMSEDSSN